MRGVIEEKSNRIVEVIISSVKPFQLMMGKIIGVGLVALTQFALWGVLTIGLYSVAVPLLMPDIANQKKQEQIQNFVQTDSSLNSQMPVNSNDEMTSELFEMMGALNNINFTVMILSFIFFFFGGFFLYSAMFAAIGSAVDSEADTQQFMLPVTIPLILAIVVMINIVQNPESQIAYWFSIIPFTSPVVMMARIPFGVPYSQIFLSIFLLIITFILIIWLSAKIYRTGILMYGKKTSWKEIWKWIKYKN
jgi:ABC-2 type transport system permease protein